MRIHAFSEKLAKEKVGENYWENEQIVYAPERLNQLTENGINVDIVCTHTAPSFCKPFDKENIQEWLLCDKELSKDLDLERKNADLIYKHLKNDGHPLKEWVYAHFHFHNTEVIDNVKFTLLDMFRHEINNFDFARVAIN